jgi:hypothetical protein
MRCRVRPSDHAVRRHLGPNVPVPCPTPLQRSLKVSARAVDAQSTCSSPCARSATFSSQVGFGGQ